MSVQVRCIGSSWVQNLKPISVPVPTGERLEYKAGGAILPTTELYGSITDVLKAAQEFRNFHRETGRKFCCAYSVINPVLYASRPSDVTLRTGFQLYTLKNLNEEARPELAQDLLRELQQRLSKWKKGLYLAHTMNCCIARPWAENWYDKELNGEVEVPYPTGEVKTFRAARFEVPVLSIEGRLSDVANAVRALHGESKDGWVASGAVGTLAMLLDHPGEVYFIGSLWRDKGNCTHSKFDASVIEAQVILAGLTLEHTKVEC